MSVPLCNGVDGSRTNCDSPEQRKVDEATACRPCICWTGLESPMSFIMS